VCDILFFKILKMSIKILFGLGNIGDEYLQTRHNAGVIVLKNLAQIRGVEFAKNKFCNAEIAKIMSASHSIILAFCQGYMNNSGVGVKKVLSFFKFAPNEVGVIYDDITLPVGRVKISQGGSSGGHNGINDIMQKIGNDFARIRIGIGSKQHKAMALSDHVLGKLSAEDIEAFKAFDICSCVDMLVSEGIAKTQNTFNRTDT